MGIQVFFDHLPKFFPPFLFSIISLTFSTLKKITKKKLKNTEAKLERENNKLIDKLNLKSKDKNEY